MGFVVGTPITDDGDIYKYTGEQQFANLCRGGNTLSGQHLAAVEAIIAFLSAEWSTERIAAMSDDTVTRAKPIAAHWVAWKILDGQGGRNANERQAALDKAAKHEKQFNELLAGDGTSARPGLVIRFSDTTATQVRKGLPIVVSQDYGSMFSRDGTSRPAQVGANEIAGFNLRVIEGQ